MTYRRIHGKVNVLLCFRAKIVACHKADRRLRLASLNRDLTLLRRGP